MKTLYRLRGLVRWLFRRDEIERSLDTDLADYIERSAAEKIRAGMSAAEARRAARIELGGVEQTKNSVRERLSLGPVETFVTDAGYGAVAIELGALVGRLGLPGVALSLEGGYDLDGLRRSAAATVRGLLAGMNGGGSRRSRRWVQSARSSSTHFPSVGRSRLETAFSTGLAGSPRR